MVKVKGQGQKAKGQGQYMKVKKLKCSESHETQESGKKNFSIQITLVDLASEQTAGNHDTNCVESIGKNTHHVPKMV